MTFLLDANVLIALVDPDHVHHRSAGDWFSGSDEVFATCPITQGALVRHLLRVDHSVSDIGAAIARIQALPRHEFWPDDVPFTSKVIAGVVGHLNSGTSIPASDIYNKAGVPVISGSATNPKLTEQGFKVQFRVVARDDQQGPAVANYLASSKKPKLVAVIDDATAYGEGLANEVEKSLKAANVKVLPREKGTDKTTDWKAVLTKVKGRNADAVFYGGMDATGGPLLKQARELGLKAVFTFGDGACTDEMPKLAGAAADGLLCSQAGLPPQAADKKFLDAYKKKFNVDPIIYAPFTYDAANLLIEAMKKANSADPAKYLPELAKIDYKGATGQIAFDDKGDRKGAEITIGNAMWMENFESKTLNRKFDHILFGSLAGGANLDAMAAAADLPAGHPDTSSAAAAPSMSQVGDILGDAKVDKATGKDARTVAEIWAQRKELGGKEVVIRAKVVKFNPEIMGKNWIHLRDGSGSAEKGDNDLTVTTDAVVAKGDIVSVRGKVGVDRDFTADRHRRADSASARLCHRPRTIS